MMFSLVTFTIIQLTGTQIFWRSRSQEGRSLQMHESGYQRFYPVSFLKCYLAEMYRITLFQRWCLHVYRNLFVPLWSSFPVDAEATSMEVATWLCHLCCGKFLSVYSSKRDTVTFVIIIFFFQLRRGSL